MKGKVPQASAKHGIRNRGGDMRNKKNKKQQQQRRKPGKQKKNTLTQQQEKGPNVPLDGMSNFERLMLSSKNKGKEVVKSKKKISKGNNKGSHGAKASAVKKNATSSRQRQQQHNARRQVASSSSDTHAQHKRAVTTASGAPEVDGAAQQRSTANKKGDKQRTSRQQRGIASPRQASSPKKRPGSAYENALIARVLAKVNESQPTRWFEEEDADEGADFEEQDEHGGAATEDGAAPKTKRARVTTVSTSSSSASFTTTTSTSGGNTTTTSTTMSSASTSAHDSGDGVLSSRRAMATTSSTSTAGKLAGLEGSAKVTKLLAIDCEMVGVGRQGLNNALARCSIVNGYGEVVIDTYVKPKVRVIDYRTHVSGIRPHHLTDAPTHSTVRERVAALIKNRILVGHAIMNDLKVLRLFHPRHLIRDTSLYKPFQAHAGGKKPALRKLAKNILGVELQKGEHDSVEDAKAALRLYKHVKADWESGITFGKNAKIVPAPAATGNGAQQRANGGAEEKEKQPGSGSDKDDIAMLYQDSEMVDTHGVSQSAHGDGADDLQVGFTTKDGQVVRKYSNKHQNWRYVQRQKKRGLM